MTSRSKGNAAERRAELELRAEGFLVHRALASGFWFTPKPRFPGDKPKARYLTRSHDVFGVADLVALPLGAGAVRLIQVHAGSNTAARRAKIESAHSWVDRPCVQLEVWTWRGGRVTKRAKLRQTWKKQRLDFVAGRSIWDEL